MTRSIEQILRAVVIRVSLTTSFVIVLLALLAHRAAADPTPTETAMPKTATSELQHPVDVWIDVDIAAGLFRRDVDDGLAMIQTFHSPELRVRGVSVVYGNAPLKLGLPIAREVTERFGPPGLAIHPGAEKAEQLGESNAAVEAMAEALREAPMTILALGPLTNVASLLQIHPDLADRIERIVMVAGRRPGQSFRTGEKVERPFQDFNFENDPEAAAVLLKSDVDLWLAPWEVSSHVWIRDEDLARLGEGSESGRWIADKSRSWIGFWKEYFGADGFNPFDTLGVAALTHPHLIESFEGRAAIEQAPDDIALADLKAKADKAEPPVEAPPAIPLKPYLHVRDEPGGRRVRYFFRPSPEFQPILIERLNVRPES